MSESTIIEDIERLRAIPAKWKGLADPLADADRIRKGYEPLPSTEHFYNCGVCSQFRQCSVYENLRATSDKTQWFRDVMDDIRRGDSQDAIDQVAYRLQQAEVQQAERINQHQQLRDLLEIIESADIETAKDWLQAAIKLLEK